MHEQIPSNRAYLDSLLNNVAEFKMKEFMLAEMRATGVEDKQKGQ